MRNMANECRTSCSRNYRDDCNHNHGYKTSCDSDYKCNKSKNKRRRSLQANLATSMATRPSTPTRSAAITPKIASRAAAIATTTTTESTAMMRTTITTNATSVAKMSLQTTIVRQSRATMKERNRAQAAETASAMRKITMSIQVKYLEKRGRLVWPKGPHFIRIFEMRSHLIPRSMWHTHYFKMSLTKTWLVRKSLMTSRIRLPSNDAPRQWNLEKWYQSHVRLKIILYRTEMI